MLIRPSGVPAGVRVRTSGVGRFLHKFSGGILVAAHSYRVRCRSMASAAARACCTACVEGCALEGWPTVVQSLHLGMPSLLFYVYADWCNSQLHADASCGDAVRDFVNMAHVRSCAFWATCVGL